MTIAYASPTYTPVGARCDLDACNARIRSYPDSNCQLDPNHRGHHASRTYVCDGCGKVRRGFPKVYRDAYGDALYASCFLCERGLS